MSANDQDPAEYLEACYDRYQRLQQELTALAYERGRARTHQEHQRISEEGNRIRAEMDMLRR